MQEKYEFMHGRQVWAWICGVALGLIVGGLLLLSVELFEGFWADLGVLDYAEFAVIIGVFGIAALITLFPPKSFNINVPCIGILHAEHVEITFGDPAKKTATIRYDEISFIKRSNKRWGRSGWQASWHIDTTAIYEPVGLLVDTDAAHGRIEDFVQAVEQRVADLRQ